MLIGWFPLLFNLPLCLFETKQWVAQESKYPSRISLFRRIFLTRTFGVGMPGKIAVNKAIDIVPLLIDVAA